MERKLLSKRKQRAIVQLVELARRLYALRKKTGDVADSDFLERLLDVLDNPKSELLPDWGEVASRWLDVIRPVWFEKLKERRSRPLLLKDIQRNLESNPEWLMSQIREHFGTIPAPKRIDERVRACIIGVS